MQGWIASQLNWVSGPGSRKAKMAHKTK